MSDIVVIWMWAACVIVLALAWGSVMYRRSTGPLIRTGFAWWPMRLARHVPDPERPGTRRMEFVGWVWWQTVVMTNNLNHGWVVFLDSTPLKPRCRKCGQVLPPV